MLTKHLRGAFYDPPPSENPSKNLCPYWSHYKVSSKNPSKKRFLYSGHIRPPQGTEICNFRAPSPLDFLNFLQWMFSCFFRLFLCNLVKNRPEMWRNCPISERRKKHLFCASVFSFFCPVHPTLPQAIFFPKIPSFWDLKSTLSSREKATCRGWVLGTVLDGAAPQEKRKILFFWRVRKGERT